MSDDPAYILDLQGCREESPEPTDGAVTQGGRHWIGVHFECCGVYTRIYKNPSGTAYEGYCPRCAKPARVRIGPGGTSARMFRAC